MPSWPVSLPQEVGWSNYSEARAKAKIESQPDAGPIKSRPRFTAAPTIMAVELVRLTSAQVDTLLAFHDDDCAMGTIPFDWNHPRTGSSVSVVFQGDPPAIKGAARNRFTAAFSVAILP